jgi:hypothetical protein
VWVLVAKEGRDIETLFSIRFVALDETLFNQLIQQRHHVDAVVGEQFGLDPLGPILKTPLPVCEAPEASEEEPSHRRQFGQLLVGEEAGLQ